MKKISLTFLLTSTVLVALYGCGGSGGTEPPNTPVVDVVVPGNSKKDMGQLPTVNNDEDDTTDNVLNLQALQKVGMNSDLSELKVCTDTACWTILDKSGQTKSTFANKKNTKVTDRTSLIDIGSYDLNGVEGEITAIEYSYNSKVGETNLGASIKTNQELQKDLYLDLAENVSTPFSSLSIENGRHGVFLPGENFKKEFINGVIIEVENGSADEMANLYIKKIGEIAEDKVETNFHLIKFYALDHNFEDLRDLKNRFQKTFSKPISVYVPINFSSSVSSNQYIDYMKDNYVLTVNNSELDYDVVLKNNQYYLFFETDSTTIKVLFFDK